MKPIHKAAFIIALASVSYTTLAWDTRQSSEQSSELTLTSDKTHFISPLDLKLKVMENDPACEDTKRTTCAQKLVYGGNTQGGLPTLDPVFTSDPPSHVRVTFVLQRLELAGTVAGGTVTPSMVGNGWWQTYSAVADQQISDVAVTESLAELIDDDGYFLNPVIIYDALVLNACNGFAYFPVLHQANFSAEGGAQAYPFTGFDDTAIDSTGYYNFSYTVPVDPDDSDAPVVLEAGLTMSGKVSVLCTAAPSL